MTARRNDTQYSTYGIACIKNAIHVQRRYLIFCGVTAHVLSCVEPPTVINRHVFLVRLFPTAVSK